MDNEKIQMGVPISLTGTAMELNNLIEKHELENFAVYIGGKNSSYGIVWVRGNTGMVISGIHAMLQDIAKTLGKTEEEIADMVLHSVPQKVDVNYN